ncbi:MAG TPA: site-2 protease family protein [Methanospirillum sp.]|uniref:site-2 protease family protein n=1 Tax=Methanospirillum sp. TaxID=45200 RepID=UPI002B9ECA6E|nr:site-2 protease family protein [Methanospirillum sp.]HWQ65095.1 site-2 protease family protein [Methanospirillum sp.]
MDWYLVALVVIVMYLALVAIIKTYLPSPRTDTTLGEEPEPSAEKSVLASHITFYGPILALKTESVTFFDWFRKYSRGLRIYGTIGVFMVIIVSILMVAMILLSVNLTVALKPEPTAINKPQNLFLIPGLNEFVPSTFAVWFAFILTLVIHEFGHAILCRVEKIRVKAMGVLFFVIPIGAFVEPDEEEVNKSASWPKMRMYGAGIMNNMVIGVLCFVLMIGMIGWAVPSSEPIVVGFYKDYPAASAGIPVPSVIKTINGSPVSNTAEVASVLNETIPGNHILVGFEKNGTISERELNLSTWPADLGARESGFMGVYYYNGQGVIQTTQRFLSPTGFLMLLSLPFIPGYEGQQLRILGFDVEDTSYYTEPFPLYWQIIHLLFWSGFINLAAGLFNALPMLPLDGGFIFKEATERLLARRGLSRYGSQIVGTVSSLILILMVAMLTLPYLFHM